MQHVLHAAIEIDAPPGVVWEVLTDLERYEEWNPFVVSSRGRVAVGERLQNCLQPPGGKATRFKPTVTVVEPGHAFEWLGHLGVPGIFDGRHRFELDAMSTGTRLTQTEHFSGALVRLLRRSLDTKTLAGFHAMNVALKTRAEAR